MTKKTKEPTKKLGRGETLSREQLLQRCKLFKWFLEENWGPIGLDLQRVRKSNDVRAALTLVPSVKWLQPFCDPPSDCLIREGAIEADWRELNDTRKKRDAAVEAERRLFSEYHETRQRMAKPGNALKSAIAKLGPVISLLPFILVITVLAKRLQTEELAASLETLEKDYRSAVKDKQTLHERLLGQEAWYSQNEIVDFVRSRRYDRTPINFAKAMAGLPQYAWITSHRKCSEIQAESLSSTPPNYQVFTLIEKIVKKMKRLSLAEIEKTLSQELRKDNNQRLKLQIGPNWAYMKQAIAGCRGNRLKRAETPYRIMSGFLTNIHRSKTEIEIELAKREALT